MDSKNSPRDPTDFWSRPFDRRQMLKTLGAVGSVLAMSGPRVLAEAMAPAPSATSAQDTGRSAATGEIPKRPLGKTGVQVSALCFGGAHWGRMQSEAEAMRVLHEAIDAGVTFMDNAW